MEIEKHPLWKKVPAELRPLFIRRELAPVLSFLQNRFSASDVASRAKGAVDLWQSVGLLYRDSNKPEQARQVLWRWYEQCLRGQRELGSWFHKGAPLVWLRDVHMTMGHHILVKRLMMLTLIEDAIGLKGTIDKEKGGSYFRLAWEHRMRDAQVDAYAKKAFELFEQEPDMGMFPEHILMDMDDAWMWEFPTVTESSTYVASIPFLSILMDNLGDESGTTLERLATYILSVVPGFRAKRRQATHSTDHDVVCAVEGPHYDFREQLGRYFICECKDWGRPANFTTIAKFCRILDSVKCKAGILFSRKGISGKGKTRHADRELVKVYQDRGMVIMVVDENDLRDLASGASFLTMLRHKYETVRLDLKQ
jgi:hypothetical protein